MKPDESRLPRRADRLEPLTAEHGQATLPELLVLLRERPGEVCLESKPSVLDYPEGVG